MNSALWFMVGYLCCAFMFTVWCLLRSQRPTPADDYVANWHKLMALFPDE